MEATHERYNHIIQKIKEAREAGNSKQLKIWKAKLEKWQLAYGAYAPIR